jgi:hypothetical protein
MIFCCPDEWRPDEKLPAQPRSLPIGRYLLLSRNDRDFLQCCTNSTVPTSAFARMRCRGLPAGEDDVA